MRALMVLALALLAACSGPRGDDLLVACPMPGLVPDMVDLMGQDPHATHSLEVGGTH